MTPGNKSSLIKGHFPQEDGLQSPARATNHTCVLASPPPPETWPRRAPVPCPSCTLAPTGLSHGIPSAPDPFLPLPTHPACGAKPFCSPGRQPILGEMCDCLVQVRSCACVFTVHVTLSCDSNSYLLLPEGRDQACHVTTVPPAPRAGRGTHSSVNPG